LRYFRKIIPGYGGIDFASIVLMIALQMIELLLVALVYGGTPRLPGLLVLSIGKLMQLTVYVFMVAIFVRIIISWVNPGLYNAIISLLASLTDFMLQPARRLIPPIGMLDISPIAVFLLLGLILRLIVQPILDIGASMLL
jgi:YggT family protein